MQNDMPQSGESQEVAHQSSEGEHFQLSEHHKRFLTEKELDDFVGDEILRDSAAERAVMTYERHLVRTARNSIGAFAPMLVTLGPTSSVVTLREILFRPPPVAFLRARPRYNHRSLSQTDRDRLNAAIQQAHQAGTYQPLADIHAHCDLHRMHTAPGCGGSIGTQRFLPWHRLYLLECEKLLRSYQPSVRIPYWDFANDNKRPDWVWQPPNVIRNAPGAAGGSLPTPDTVNKIIQDNDTYSDFTRALEGRAHNGVHTWCNGTVSIPNTAPQDPIFWLLHANVDRIWYLWQANHDGIPSLSGNDAILDPWQPTTVAHVDWVFGLGYYYS